MSGYQLTKLDIDNLMKQVDVSEEKATELLIKHNGNMVECILDTYDYVGEKKETGKENSDKQFFTNMRKIVDNKNILYNENVNQNKQINKEMIKVI